MECVSCNRSLANNSVTCSKCKGSICYKCSASEHKDEDSCSWTKNPDSFSDDEDERFHYPEEPYEEYRSSQCQIGRSGVGYCCHDYSYECNDNVCRVCEAICFRCYMRMCEKCEAKCHCGKVIKKNVCRKCIQSNECADCYKESVAKFKPY